jgi:hypothetical protein
MQESGDSKGSNRKDSIRERSLAIVVGSYREGCRTGRFSWGCEIEGGLLLRIHCE